MSVYSHLMKVPGGVIRDSIPTFNYQSTRMSPGKVQVKMLISEGQSRFGISIDDGIYGLAVPHWFAVLITGTVATVPWIRPSRRFSLQTFLLAISAAALLAGAIAAMNRYAASFEP
jgi:hypothetical protein